ncbi:hypothetical protein [Moorella sulfitireducens (nom. illeg.)]|nr:hypothetical protein [Moorella sulfitireducens]
MDGRQPSPRRLESGQDWVELLQWLGIKVEKPRDKGENHTLPCKG